MAKGICVQPGHFEPESNKNLFFDHHMHSLAHRCLHIHHMCTHTQSNKNLKIFHWSSTYTTQFYTLHFVPALIVTYNKFQCHFLLKAKDRWVTAVINSLCNRVRTMDRQIFKKNSECWGKSCQWRSWNLTRKHTLKEHSIVNSSTNHSHQILTWIYKS